MNRTQSLLIGLVLIAIVVSFVWALVAMISYI